MPSTSPSRRDARRDEADERQPLIASSAPSQPLHYYATQQSSGSDGRRLAKSPYLTPSLRIGFFAGFVLLLLSTILLLLLLVNLFAPIPLLLPPHRSPAILPIWYCLTSIMIVAPGLLVFELASRATRVLHVGVLFFNVASLVIVAAVHELRTTHAWLGVTALALSLLSTVWALLTSQILASIQIPYTIQPQGGIPIVAHISSQDAQGKWSRAAKLFVAVIGTAIVASVMVLLTFNVSLDAADAGFRPIGNLTRVSLTKSHVRPSPTDPPTKDPEPITFRLHLACQEAPRDSDTDGDHGIDLARPSRWTTGTLKSNSSVATRPTALVMTERGVSGVIGAEWVREMVERAGSNSSSSSLDAQKKKDKDGDDGHLSLQKVCFYDRIGYGHTDYVGRPFSIAVHTEALHQALVSSGHIDGPNVNSHRQQQQQQQEAGSGRWDADKARKNSTAAGPFLLISTGFGSLFAQDFATTYPHLVHSMLFVDAETPESWYGEAVSAGSRLRAGYVAAYHGVFGSLYADLLPALIEPLGITRLLGLLRGKTVADRILAPGFHGGAHRRDPAGGGWRVRGAGGANERLLTASWHERLDANLGTASPNYVRLAQHSETWRHVVASRPVAVLSSFWKIHRDVHGWGGVQRGLVGEAKEGGSLVGWWRVGERAERAKGGDDGDAQGLCGTSLGKVFCQEAVRKVLAAGDLGSVGVV